MRTTPVAEAAEMSDRLRELRQELGISQAALGQMLGLTQGRIAQIEVNPGSVSLAQVLQLLDALGAELVVRRKK